jgi:hypothetical protein
MQYPISKIPTRSRKNGLVFDTDNTVETTGLSPFIACKTIGPFLNHSFLLHQTILGATKLWVGTTQCSLAVTY